MMDTSKAGDDTGRHVRFTWSGAVRPLRSPVSRFADSSGLHPVPPITVGVRLLCPLLTSVPSRPVLPPSALPES